HQQPNLHLLGRDAAAPRLRPGDARRAAPACPRRADRGARPRDRGEARRPDPRTRRHGRGDHDHPPRRPSRARCRGGAAGRGRADGGGMSAAAVVRSSLATSLARYSRSWVLWLLLLVAPVAARLWIPGENDKTVVIAVNG